MKAITCSLVVCGAVNLTLAMNLIDFIALTRLIGCVCKWQAVCNTQNCSRAVQFMIYDFSHFVLRHSCDWIGLALPHLPPLTNKLSYCVAQYLHGVRFFMPCRPSPSLFCCCCTVAPPNERRKRRRCRRFTYLLLMTTCGGCEMCAHISSGTKAEGDYIN